MSTQLLLFVKNFSLYLYYLFNLDINASTSTIPNKKAPKLGA